MAINPELITTIRVDQLPDEALSLTNLFPHTVGTDLKSATIQELVDLVATTIGVSGGVGYIAISVTDGQQLPDVPELPSFFLCGAGTFLNINGYPDVICTDELNAVMSLSDHWELAVGIPIVAEVGVQTVTGSAVDNTDPLNPVINEIISGVQNIIAGTNITVDNTDPANPIVSATGGVTTPTLQEVLDNNHDLVDGNNFQGTGAGVGNTGVYVNALGNSAGYENTGDNVNALGDSAGYENIAQDVNAFGSTAAFQNTAERVNALGPQAAQNNIGESLNALGGQAGLNNEGNEVNAFGVQAACGNTANNVNAFGAVAGLSNTFKNVNLFGFQATADAENQNVFSKWISGVTKYLGRLSFNNITADRKWELPDDSGTLALTSDITTPTLQQVTDVGNETTNSIKATQLVTQTNGPTKSITLSSNNVNLERTAEWQDKDYTGIADITDIPTLVAGTNISIDDTDPLNPIISSTGSGGGSGGASISFYLNGSVSQGTIGGIAFREMDRTPILGAGTDFTINANGYIQSFITDANVPNLLEIPGGNWNFETYFSASSAGGSPSFYVELYKWNGTTLSLIASNSATPEGITNGTTIDVYFSALAVPQTTLLATDRLAIRIYVTHSGKTITLHTEDNHLCQVITTFSTGLTALNGLTTQVQNLAVGTSGTDFAISSVSTTHTFNLPTASATNRGALSSTDWSTFNNKPDELQVVLLSQVFS